MKKNRYIPFGYQMANGQMIAHEQEAPIIRLIFSQYLQGTPYSRIAELLTDQDVPYHAGKQNWDKSMVKRILENERYTGTNGYPALIGKADFDYANQMRLAKNQYNNTPAAITSIKKKAVCAVCGKRFHRSTKTKGHALWSCKCVDCVPASRITDQILLDSIMIALGELIATPKLAEPNPIPDNRKSLEAIRLQNEVNRELDKPQPDKDCAKALLYKCAAQKYIDCCDCEPPHLTAEIQAALAGKQTLTAFDAVLFDSIVKHILIEPDGNIHLELINRKII